MTAVEFSKGVVAYYSSNIVSSIGRS